MLSYHCVWNMALWECKSNYADIIIRTCMTNLPKPSPCHIQEWSIQTVETSNCKVKAITWCTHGDSCGQTHDYCTGAYSTNLWCRCQIIFGQNYFCHLASNSLNTCSCPGSKTYMLILQWTSAFFLINSCVLSLLFSFALIYITSLPGI